jgi:YcxB-like protein
MPDPMEPTFKALPGQSKGMTLRFVLRTEDYVSYALSDLRTNEAQVRRTATNRVVFGVALALWFFYFSSVLGVKNIVLQVILGLIAGGLGWFYYPRMIEGFVKRNARATYKGESEQELILESDALIARSSQSEHRFDLSAIEDVIETPEHVFLLMGGRSVVILPQSAFSDAGQRTAFIAALNA